MVIHSCPPYPQNIDLVGIEWVWRRKRAKNTQGISTWWAWSGYREEKEPRIPKEYRPDGHRVGIGKKKSQEYPQNIDLVGIEWVWRRKRAKNTQGISTWWV